jgi:hypothetical protein
VLWFYLFGGVTPFWLFLMAALLFVSWLDIRRTDLRSIVQFWWLTVVLLLWVPGWIAMKVFLIVRARRAVSG